MRKLLLLLLLATLPLAAVAQGNLDWAYPKTPVAEPHDSVALKQVPGSTRKYTQAQIDDPFNPPDWFPNEHAPMPTSVARGTKPAARACAQCHLPTGDGHPESSSLAGLPVNYIIRQMDAFKNGDRTGVRAAVMIVIAKAWSDADIRAAAEYYAALKPTPGFNKVIEADRVLATYVGAGGMRFALTDGGVEPIGPRIIVLPDNPERASLRDPKSGFTDFVPRGSIAKGAALAAGANGRFVACTVCHGPTLQGLGDVPGITGRPATYMFRQLNDMKTGARKGPGTELMKPIVEKLSQDDMIALAAYLGSRDP